MQLWPVFWRVYNVTCRRVLGNENFLDIYLTTFFGVRKFKNTFKLWRSAFFWKFSNVKLNLENPKKKKKKSENIFPYWDNWIWKRCYKLSLLRKKYLLSAVNWLTNSLKILHITQRDFFNPNFFHRDQKIWSTYCRSALNSISATLRCYFSKGPLKRDFLDIYLNTFFGACKFKNTSGRRIIFF